MVAAERLPAEAASAFAAALLTSIGAGIPGGQRLTLGLPLVTAGFVAACIAAHHAVRPRAPVSTRWASDAIAVLAAVAALGAPRDHPPLWYEIVYRAVPATGVLVAAWLAADRPARRRVLWIGVALTVALQLTAPIVNRAPFIDVWQVTTTAIRALLRLDHPYLARAADIYRGGFTLGYRTTVYPYMPLTAVLGAPLQWLAGDYRFALALCLPATIALVRAAGARLAVDGRFLDAITCVLVFAPGATYLVASGYNEPLLVATAALAVFLIARRRSATAPAIAFMLLPALKQYVLMPPVLFLVDAWRRRAWRALVAGPAAAFATVAPFLLWNARATLAGVLFQIGRGVGFREDSLSLTALVARATGAAPCHWLPEVAQVVAGAIAYWPLRNAGAAGLFLASAIAVDASFLFGVQAFANYYAFVTMLLLMAALLFARRDAAIA